MAYSYKIWEREQQYKKEDMRLAKLVWRTFFLKAIFSKNSFILKLQYCKGRRWPRFQFGRSSFLLSYA